VERKVDDSVRFGSGGAQAVEVVESTAMRVGAGSRQRCCGGVRTGAADDLMPRFEEFADNRRSDESGRSGDKHTHGEIPFR